MNIQKASKILCARDPKLGLLIERLGILELPHSRGPYETLVEAIISQQVSTKAAATIHGRLIDLLSNDLSPASLLSKTFDELRSVGLSRQKATYLQALSEAFAKKAQRYERLHEMEDAEVIKSLTEIKGLGLWTAQMFLIFNLLREDVFPVDDLGIRRAMERSIFSPHETPSKADMSAHAEIWKPYRSVASLYLWKSVD